MCWTFRSDPVSRLSMQITRYPLLRSASQRCDPRKPAPPVTTQVLISVGRVRHAWSFLPGTAAAWDACFTRTAGEGGRSASGVVPDVESVRVTLTGGRRGRAPAVLALGGAGLPRTPPPGSPGAGAAREAVSRAGGG